MDENDEASIKLKKQSTEYKGLKRMYSLNNDPKEETSNDLAGLRDSNKSMTMRSKGSGNYEGDNLIEVEDLEPKTWHEDDEIQETHKTGDVLNLPTGDGADESVSYKSKKSFNYVKKGSVVAKLRTDGAEVRESHVDDENDKRKTEILRAQASGVGEVEEEQALPDQLFIATRIKNIFKRTSGEGCFNTCWLVVDIPLNFLRNYSVPPADHADWDRNRMSILPLTIPISFFYLKGYLAEDDIKMVLTICGIMLIPGFMSAVYVQCRTTKTRPPVVIMTIGAIMGFFMSIIWIGFTSDVVIDILEIIGIIIHVPKSVLGLTLLAWGNCLGDMSADVAMTKKGFGEMAITGCMAGPVFNILMGLGLSMVSVFLQNPDKPSIDWYLFNDDGTIELTSIAPFALISSLIIVQMIILANACVNNYSLSIGMQHVNVLLYFAIVIGLVAYVLSSDAV